MKYRTYYLFTILLSTMLMLMPTEGNAEEIAFAKGTLHINVLSDNAVRLQYEESNLPDLPEYVYLPQQSRTHYSLKTKGKLTTLKTAVMRVVIDSSNGSIVAYDKSSRR